MKVLSKIRWDAAGTLVAAFIAGQPALAARPPLSPALMLAYAAVAIDGEITAVDSHAQPVTNGAQFADVTVTARVMAVQKGSVKVGDTIKFTGIALISLNPSEVPLLDTLENIPAHLHTGMIVRVYLEQRGVNLAIEHPDEFKIINGGP